MFSVWNVSRITKFILYEIITDKRRSEKDQPQPNHNAPVLLSESVNFSGNGGGSLGNLDIKLLFLAIKSIQTFKVFFMSKLLSFKLVLEIPAE